MCAIMTYISNAVNEIKKKKIKLKFLNYIILAPRDVSGFNTFCSRLADVRLPSSTRLRESLWIYVFYSYCIMRKKTGYSSF